MNKTSKEHDIDFQEWRQEFEDRMYEELFGKQYTKDSIPRIPFVIEESNRITNDIKKYENMIRAMKCKLRRLDNHVIDQFTNNDRKQAYAIQS